MFKISEFARLADVSTHLLRHYDTIGLFKPATIDEVNNYRLYAINQLPQLHRILALRDLGFVLDDIKTMLRDNISPEQIQGMLQLKRDEINREIRDAQSRLSQIEQRLTLIKEDNLSDYSVVIKSFNAQKAITTGRITVTDESIAQILGETYTLLKQKNDAGTTFALVIVHDNSTPEGLHNVEVGFPIDGTYPDGITLSTGRTLTMRTLDNVPIVASVVNEGARDNNSRVYEAIFSWMEANNYIMHPSEPPREIYLQARGDKTNPQNVVEFLVPIIKNNTD